MGRQQDQRERNGGEVKHLCKGGFNRGCNRGVVTVTVVPTLHPFEWDTSALVFIGRLAQWLCLIKGYLRAKKCASQPKEKKETRPPKEGRDGRTERDLEREIFSNIEIYVEDGTPPPRRDVNCVNASGGILTAQDIKGG